MYIETLTLFIYTTRLLALLHMAVGLLNNYKAGLTISTGVFLTPALELTHCILPHLHLASRSHFIYDATV